MCFLATIAAMLGPSVVGCDPFQGLGLDPASHTDAVVVSLPHREQGYFIKCPQSTAACLGRAQAICQGPFRVLPPTGRRPKIQALIDFQIKEVDTSNPSEITVICNGL